MFLIPLHTVLKLNSRIALISTANCNICLHRIHFLSCIYKVFALKFHWEATEANKNFRVFKLPFIFYKMKYSTFIVELYPYVRQFTISSERTDKIILTEYTKAKWQVTFIYIYKLLMMDEIRMSAMRFVTYG